jgi:fido (protein-threonine AMPylation protein)
MHPHDCPPWEYDSHIHRVAVLSREVATIIVELRQGALDTRQVAMDTRGIHERLFRDLTPSGYAYYAGHYRGENYRCLKHHAVGILSDPRVGCPPQQVLSYMNELARIIQATLATLDARRTLPDTQLLQAEKLLYLVATACWIFDFFLRIHPYVNGNGHVARFLMWAILGRYNFWPTKWPIEPRPNDPPYTQCIIAYRNENPIPLESFVLSSLSS